MARGGRITVAGAGALGLSLALALADEGFQVTVCDPAEPFSGASGVAAGMLAPGFEAVLDAQTSADFDLLLAARDLWPVLEGRAGVQLDRSGALAAGSEAWLTGVRAGLMRLGLHGVELPEATVQALAPGLTRGGALLNREDWRLEPRAALRALRRASEAAGVTFRGEAVRDRGDADHLVLATGYATGLAPELARLSPIKGHILRVATPDAGHLSVRGEGVYAVPAQGGLAVGATMELGVADAAIDPAQEHPLRTAGARLFPRIAEAPGELFAGVRAATPDGLPMAGASAEPGVWLAVGARRNGWLLAPLVARTIAACLTGRDPGPYAGRLDPGRFDT
jgi:glycine oxidase